ncbi:MAG: hypothetical protein HQL09_10155, partial [Nitrospirae bacterium]|nr:hypothetical protein [Nitrospirota bacterium]
MLHRKQAIRKVAIRFLQIAVCLLPLALCVTPSFALKCIDSTGEAAINNSDIPSAKTEAIARAKWAAVEQVAGVEVRAQTVVQNMVLVDDAISKQIRGVISGYKVTAEKTGTDAVWVKINACVEPVKAQEAASSMALNNSVAVFIPARKPRVVSESEYNYASGHSSKASSYNSSTLDEYDETNILSENLIGRLAEQGYTVVDVAPTHAMEAREIENAIRSGNALTVRSLMYKFLSNV